MDKLEVLYHEKWLFEVVEWLGGDLIVATL